MQAGTPNVDWNELQFLDWNEFKQMTPTILQLEVARLGGVIDSNLDDTDFHNSLVRSRYELQKFIACLGRAEKDTIEESCCEHLRLAIINLSILPDAVNAQTRNICTYVLDRLNYVYNRIRLIY